MKVIANIPEDMLQELKDGCFGVKHTLYDLAGAICNGVVLPDNATNGDMIKAMFPNVQVVDAGIHRITVIFGDCHNMMYRNSYDEDWWNAPYQGGQEDGKA